MNTHEPRHEFIERLRTDVAHRVRARQHGPSTALHAPWLWRSRWALPASLAGIVLVSMAIGGAVVAAAYESQTNERRQLMAATYERQLQLALMKAEIAKSEMASARARADVGTAPPEDAAEAQVKVQEAEAQVSIAHLNLDEVRVSGQDPLNGISAPLVGGKDYVVLRLESSLMAPLAALDLEKLRLQRAERRFQVGVADNADVMVISGRITELEAAIRSIRQQIAVRQRFVKGEFNAAVAELEVLLVQAQQRRQALEPQIQSAKRSAERTKTLFERGLVTQSEVAKAQLRLLELTTEASKQDLELTLVQEQLKQRRGK